jgi:hypothetical protein
MRAIQFLCDAAIIGLLAYGFVWFGGQIVIALLLRAVGL